MAYISLYRKYRPATFDELVGQEHIVKILKNQVKNSRIGHAYLFTGTRGTGKTSVARMFAKAINCLNNVDGSPCGVCSVCKELANSSNLDIIEIDAASNNGIDEMRELRDNVKYQPLMAKFKVYIIDEAHMLTPGAFDALLKTLEEPPSHAVFILATTEVHKVPQTILSRCLRFDFRLLPPAQVAERIKFIFDDIGVKYTNDAILSIAEAGEGSMRDSLSIADMCMSYSDGEVDYDDVLEVLGTSNPNTIVDIIQTILKGDIVSAFTLVNDVSKLGKSMSLLARDLAKMFRHLYIAKNCADPQELLPLPLLIVDKLVAMKEYNNDRVLQCVEIMCSIESGMRYSALPRVMLESAIAKAAEIKANYDMIGLITRVKALEQKIANGAVFSEGRALNNNSENNITINNNSESKTTLNKEFNQTEICGYIIKSLREKKLYTLFAQLSNIDKSAYRLDGNCLTINVKLEADVKSLEIPQYFETLKEIISDMYPSITELKFRALEIENDVSQQVEVVKSMFDKSIVTINKLGGK